MYIVHFCVDSSLILIVQLKAANDRLRDHQEELEVLLADAATKLKTSAKLFTHALNKPSTTKYKECVSAIPQLSRRSCPRLPKPGARSRCRSSNN